MTRDIASATQTASQASTIAPVWLVKLEFDAGDVCLHTGLGDLAWGGDTYVGAGGLGGIGTVDEDAELGRSTLDLTLRGLPTDVVAIVMSEHYQGRPATLYLGYLDLTTQALVADPAILYRGRMDNAHLVQGEGSPPTMTVTLRVESRFAAWDRPQARRYNDADQQARWPGDSGLAFVEQAAGKQIFWGQKAP